MKIMEGIALLPWATLEKTPWRLRDGRNICIASCVSLETNNNPSPVQLDTANAAYIAHACNHYPWLIEALTKCLAYFEERMDADQPPGSAPCSRKQPLVWIRTCGYVEKGRNGWGRRLDAVAETIYLRHRSYLRILLCSSSRPTSGRASHRPLRSGRR